MQIEEFNALERADAVAALRPCLDVERWAAEIVDGRPYADTDALAAAAEGAASPLRPDEVAQAMSHHPRIGEQPAGEHAEARASRAEQAGIGTVDDDVAQALRAGNRAYEERFDRVFLIRAAGRSAEEILGALTERLGHTAEEEDEIVADQLRQIAVLRLRGLIAP
ncbi:2-oxo-4-hydroxy-4-carboxy-5-ureidoimidazoline decarboxylase [Cellulomonas sp. PhB143]|uniref:2-oxo-4-hydroxy-4-carboxy-5-ureidoimidazoline decarboxylase n=1 Tax=Cellulomonas sp. PhB143 TaxID=2485186 RepID=UPI000FAB42A7|nr:2-oxo-4-hydroxy-4-carboxy-5-ureidoimidazoline decarboxylase [Cellulomonas sp. PhB143]ROS78945.1 2-oxo-4-hydroxy-4-carboxy-5-ureidoimidazoline decarboxylase [Cellulomonas sp. PhB143]